MCGRYTLVRIADLSGLFPWITEDLPDAPPRYNIAPTQPVLAVASDVPVDAVIGQPRVELEGMGSARVPIFLTAARASVKGPFEVTVTTTEASSGVQRSAHARFLAPTVAP